MVISAVLGRTRSFEALQKHLPFICTASTKANCAKHYPSEILAGLLYLGDWASAEATDRFGELNIRRPAPHPPPVPPAKLARP